MSFLELVREGARELRKKEEPFFLRYKAGKALHDSLLEIEELVRRNRPEEDARKTAFHLLVIGVAACVLFDHINTPATEEPCDSSKKSNTN